MHKHLYRVFCGIAGIALLGGCQSESIQDKVAKVDEKTKPAIGTYWPAGVPQPSDLNIGPGGDIDLQKIDLLQYWPTKSNTDEEQLQEQLRQMIATAEDTLMSGKLTEAAQQYEAAENFAKEKFGNLDYRRLIAHFGMVKVYTAQLKLDDALAVARETLELAEKATPRDEDLISQINGDIEKLEQAKAKRSGSATKDN
jgi:hypothetical protein